MAWVTKAALASLADVSAAALVSQPTQTRAAVDARVVSGTASAVSAALANNQTVKDAAAAAMSDAAVQAQVRWNKPALTAETEIDTYRTSAHAGSYPVPSGAVATAVGLPEASQGTLTVQWVTGGGANGAAYQEFVSRSTGVRYRRSAAAVYETWTAWTQDLWKKSAAAGADIDTLLDPGHYNIGGNALTGAVPFGSLAYSLEVLQIGATLYVHRATNQLGVVATRIRLGTGLWSAWSTNEKAATLITSTSDLDLMTETGDFVGGFASPVLNSPFGADRFFLEVRRYGGDHYMQRATHADGRVLMRIRVGVSSPTWGDWISIGARTGGGEASGVGALATLGYEATGEYTPPAEAESFLEALAEHRLAEKFVIGQTVLGADIPAIRIGNPDKPALFVGVGVHGSEVGSRDAALLWARDLLDRDDYLLLDLCVVVVPNINIDRWNNTYVNANNVNINSDFITKLQPEVQAITSLLNDPDFDFVAGIDVHNFGYERQVSIRYPEEEGSAHLDVQAQASALYDAVFAAHEDAGQSVRRYGDPGNGGSLWRALGQQWAVPSLLVEIPSFSPSNENYAANPRRAEVARFKVSANAFLQHVNDNLTAIVTARDAGLADPVPVTPIPAP